MQAAATVALPQSQPLGARLADAVAGLPDARWLDRLLRGRAWIPLIALGLIGLVFMQVSMLGMNAGIGQAVEKSAALERQNADMRAEVSQLSSADRIQREAAAAGLIMPPAGDVRYLRSNGLRDDAARAAKVMRAPSDQAKATAAAASAGAEGVGSPLAGDTATQPGATGAAGTAAAGTTSGAQAQTQAEAPAQAQTQAAPAQTQPTAPAQTQQQTQGQTPAPQAQAQTQAAPAQTQQQASVQQSAPATAAGAAVAPGNG